MPGAGSRPMSTQNDIQRELLALERRAGSEQVLPGIRRLWGSPETDPFPGMRANFEEK